MSDLVWSSSGGDQRKQRPQETARPAAGGRVKVKREIAGRRGKEVTSVTNFCASTGCGAFFNTAMG